MTTSRKSVRSRVVWVMIGLVAVGGASVYWSRTRTPPPTYREAKIERGDLVISIQATGTVQPENRLEIKPPIAGRVEKVLVDEGQEVRKGQILAWMSSTERAALLDAARAQGAVELAKWEDLYRPTPVLAPIKGTVILRSVESGQTFTANDAILVMSDRLLVKAQVDETDVAQVKVGQAAEITLDAYPSQKIPARVGQIAFEAKTVNNVTTYSVDVQPLETPDFMRAGMTANVSFVADSRTGILLVPNEVLKEKDGRTEALVPGPEGVATPIEIKVGLSDGKKSEVLSGLKEGDTVLALQLKPGEKATGNSSPFSPMGRPRGSRGTK